MTNGRPSRAIGIRVRIAERGRKEDEEGRTKKWVFVLLGLSLRRRFFKFRVFF